MQYTPVGDAYVAYEVVGSGERDIVFHPGWYSHIDAQWDSPPIARFLERLSKLGRLIMFNRRGHGMSDPVDLDNITLEQWMEDLSAVMDAVGSSKAVLIGTTEVGSMQILHAATYPERTAAIVLINTTACVARRPDYPLGMPDRVRARSADDMRAVLLGTAPDAVYEFMIPGVGSSRRGKDSLLRELRYATSPGIVHRLMTISMEVDVRELLPSVRVPTLIIHREAQPWLRVEHGRYLAERIAGAKYVELPGGEMMPWTGDQGAILDEIEEFVTGVRPVPDADRVLATVLFTDIVSSTEHASAVGDRRWLETLERHNRVVRRELERFRGNEVDTAGDGFVATFDGPARAVRCACAIVDGVAELGIDVRAGLHTGEIEFSGKDVGGIAVHIGARVGALAGTREVLVSRTVVDLVAGSGLSFSDRGAHSLKGVPGDWQLYAVER